MLRFRLADGDRTIHSFVDHPGRALGVDGFKTRDRRVIVIHRTGRMQLCRRWRLIHQGCRDHRPMTGATGSIGLGLLLAPLFDFGLVLGAFQFFLFYVRRSLLGRGVAPHFSQQARHVRIAHVRILLLDGGPTLLRVLEKGRHWTLGGERMLFGATFGYHPRTLVFSLLTHKSVKRGIDRLID